MKHGNTYLNANYHSKYTLCRCSLVTFNTGTFNAAATYPWQLLSTST